MGTYVDDCGGYEISLWEPDFELEDVTRHIPHIAVEWDKTQSDWLEQLDALMEVPGADQIQGLSIGHWGNPQESDPLPLVERLAERLPGLRALLVANMDYEECEISWIQLADLGPLLNRMPALEHLMVFGSTGLRLTGLDLPRLQSLALVNGGLAAEVVDDVLGAPLPALTRLELYTGDTEYGATSTLETLEPLLGGRVHTGVTHLAIADCEYVDKVVERLTTSPVLDRLRVLDLSNGILTDAGGRALLSDPRVARLELLDLEYHFLSQEVMDQLEALPCEVDLSDPMAEHEDEEDWSVAIGE